MENNQNFFRTGGIRAGGVGEEILVIGIGTLNPQC
jgi:hypothetical protein